MNKVKLRFITMISLALLFVLTLGCAFSLMAPRRAYAADSTYAPSSIFWSRTGGEVKAYQAGEGPDAYVTFCFSDGGSVEYHRNLALKWFEKSKGTSTEFVNPGMASYFSMEFAFGALNFSKYTIKFQSTEENFSKEGQAVNEIVFENDNGTVKAYIKDATHQDDEDFTPVAESMVTVNTAEAITLSFTDADCDPGEFAVSLNTSSLGKIVNVGGNFMEYRTSGTANTPMTFTAELTKAAKTGSLKQKVFMHSLNGQSLVVTGGTAQTAESDGTAEHTGGTVKDNAPAVLVLSEKLYSFSLGQRFSLDYKAIDVCKDNPTEHRSYYMLKKDTEGENEGKYHKPNEETDDDYKNLLTTNYFMPRDDQNEEEREYVSIRFTLDDGREGWEKEYVYLTWYAAPGVVEKLGEGDNAFDYILVEPAAEKEGPYYTVLNAKAPASDGGIGENEKVDETEYNRIVDEYQTAVEEAAKDLGSGSGAYFYLPSLRSLIASDYADYRNLRFTISYKRPVAGTSASTETSLRYNNLRFQVEKAGLYRFRVFASDASGKTMQYYDKNGKLVSVTTDNVWDLDGIPEFELNVSYKGATIEDPGEQSLGYRGSNYSISSFEIIEGENCEKEYELYYFKDKSKVSSYSDFVENAEKYFTDTYAGDDNFEKIGEYNDEVKRGDDAWDDTYNDYAWDPDSSLSFTPKQSGYYVVVVTHTDHDYGNKVTNGYMVIDVRNPIDYTPGQSEWLQNNVTSVVLFSISGVLAIAIVILFVVKPSDKDVETVDLEKLKGKKPSKNDKK